MPTPNTWKCHMPVAITKTSLIKSVNTDWLQAWASDIPGSDWIQVLQCIYSCILLTSIIITIDIKSAC